MKLLFRLAVNAGAVWLAVAFIDGLTFDGTWITLVIIGAVLAVLNAVVKPVARLLSLPFIILTLGLFLLVVNAVLLQVVVMISRSADLGLDSTGFGATFLGAIVVAIATWIGEAITGIER